MYTLIEIAKLNGVDPQAWLVDVLARLPDHPAWRLDDLLPWICTTAQSPVAAGPVQPPAHSTRGVHPTHTHHRALHEARRRAGEAIEIVLGRDLLLAAKLLLLLIRAALWDPARARSRPDRL
jgi:hypothetical protein